MRVRINWGAMAPCVPPRSGATRRRLAQLRQCLLHPAAKLTSIPQRREAWSPLPSFTAQDVAQHDSEDDCWLVIEGFVYDVTPFLRSHPGGVAIILPYAGRDATQIFHELHDADFLQEFGRRYIIGLLDGIGQPDVPRGSGLKGGGITPRAGKLYLPDDPRGMEWPDGFPKAFRWLAARYVPQSLPLPLSLRPLSSTDGHSGATGLHVMSPAHWIEVDNDCFESEMEKKRKLLLTERCESGANPWYNNVFQAETDTAAEQEELLEVLIDNLVTHHPDEYTLRGREITVEKTGDVYCIDEWTAPHVDSVGRCDIRGNDANYTKLEISLCVVQMPVRRKTRITNLQSTYLYSTATVCATIAEPLRRLLICPLGVGQADRDSASISARSRGIFHSPSQRQVGRGFRQ